MKDTLVLFNLRIDSDIKIRKRIKPERCLKYKIDVSSLLELKVCFSWQEVIDAPVEKNPNLGRVTSMQ